MRPFHDSLMCVRMINILRVSHGHAHENGREHREDEGLYRTHENLEENEWQWDKVRNQVGHDSQEQHVAQLHGGVGRGRQRQERQPP